MKVFYPIKGDLSGAFSAAVITLPMSIGYGIIAYSPQPVVAGFMNGIAFLLIFKQIKPLLGVDSSIPFVQILFSPSLVQGLTFLVGIVTIVAIVLVKRYVKTVPASFAASI